MTKMNEEMARKAAMMRLNETQPDSEETIQKQEVVMHQPSEFTQRQRVSKINDDRWHDVSVDKMPLGIFYQSGIHIQARAVTVSEVQYYSTIDNNNIYDITEKMNDVLNACVKVTFQDGSRGSYRDIFDGDRLYLIFLIRELSFQSNAGVTVKAKCPACKIENEIAMAATAGDRRDRTIENYELTEKIAKWYNPKTKSIRVKNKLDGSIIEMRPPTIGMQREFYLYIKKCVQDGGEPNISFIKVMPYLLKTEPKNIDDIELLLTDFTQWSMEYYTICNNLVDLMTMGIKGLVKQCDSCGAEVRTKVTFPNGASALLVIPIELDDFIE